MPLLFNPGTVRDNKKKQFSTFKEGVVGGIYFTCSCKFQKCIY